MQPNNPEKFLLRSFDQLELHIVADSSQDVFCSVAYLRAKVKSESQECTEIAFVLGKARVAPMKCLTVPKLELQAALLATRLKVDITKALTIPLSRVFKWTDSTSVLEWLGSLDKQLLFVANRVSEILESTTVDQWLHVSTADNPANLSPQGYFSLGRIRKLRFGDDGFARSTEIRTKSGNYVRPVVKLIPVFATQISGPEDVVNTNVSEQEM